MPQLPHPSEGSLSGPPAKCFGVPIKIGALPIGKQNQQISKRQSFWLAGVLGWGVALFMLGTLAARLIDHRRPTILEDLLGFILVVVFGGLLSQGDYTYPIDESRQTRK